jgi:hypothetical protein
MAMSLDLRMGTAIEDDAAWPHTIDIVNNENPSNAKHGNHMS